ncbi:universal stress protein [Ornithinibacillus halophilus]|uniref:Nucleotide-binding universal stress protein, UspA family n=1 Tax=Ornithinibacillus halophilus TaxID=930117 RepID=A0A1M5E8E8_9BACI|nr:universal stress protein [Ornithinibacillus halophilus]SHF75331.1 Nucleotide-binding universal stress protein, UspA family [Ornithinibacillus halophilus]
MRKILVAYDGSDLSKKALNKAKAQIKFEPDTELHVVTIVPNTGPTTNAAIAHSIQMELAEDFKEELKAIRENSEDSMNIRTSVIIDNYHWNAGMKLCQYAEEHNIDEIIVGSRGLGGMKKFFLGSVSNHILHHADCEILIVK